MRYLRLLGLQLRVSLQLSMQYRWDFFLEGLLAIFGAGVALLPLWVAFGARERIGSDPAWTFPESLVVLAWFGLLKGVLEGAHAFRRDRILGRRQRQKRGDGQPQDSDPDRFPHWRARIRLSGSV